MAQRREWSEDTPALILAAKEGNTDLVKLLVQQGHALNARDRNGATALYWACCRGHDSICEVLLGAGCDSTACVNWGATALLAAADNGQEGCVRLLLRRNVDVNVATNRGDTPLHVAAYRGYLNILRLLEEAGADPFRKNSSSLTPVQEAHVKQQKQCVANLLQYMESLGITRFSSLPTVAHHANEPPASLDEFSSWPILRKIPSPPQNSRFSNDENLLPRPLAEKVANGPADVTLPNSARNPPHNQIIEPGQQHFLQSNIKSNENLNPAGAVCSVADNEGKILNTPVKTARLPTESAAFESDDASSFESLSGKALQIPTRQGSPASKNTSPYGADVNQENRSTIFCGRGREAEQNNLNRPNHEEFSAPPSLPPRPQNLRTNQGQQPQIAPALWHIKDKASNTGNMAPPLEVDQSRRGRHTHREVMPGVRVGDFVEQLQLQMVELQEKLSQFEALNGQLRDQLQVQQAENVALRNENARLLSLLHPRKTRNIQPRGQAEFDSDERQSPYQSCQSAFMPASHPQQFYTSESGNAGTGNIRRSKQPVESSEFDTDL